MHISTICLTATETCVVVVGNPHSFLSVDFSVADANSGCIHAEVSGAREPAIAAVAPVGCRPKQPTPLVLGGVHSCLAHRASYMKDGCLDLGSLLVSSVLVDLSNPTQALSLSLSLALSLSLWLMFSHAPPHGPVWCGSSHTLHGGVSCIGALCCGRWWPFCRR